MDHKTAIRIIKAVVTWNQQPVEFNKNYLEYLDNFELLQKDTEDGISLKTQLKKEK